MHAFESLVAEILEAQGYWIQRSFKVNLTKDEKQKIGRPSSPRWELDLLAYKAPDNRILVVECKSYLDSSGVDLDDIKGGRYKKRYKLFSEPTLREVVLERLKFQIVDAKLCPANPTIQLALAAGRLKSDAQGLDSYFKAHGWHFFGPDWIRDRLRDSADDGYTNSVAVMVAKILLTTNGGR